MTQRTLDRVLATLPADVRRDLAVLPRARQVEIARALLAHQDGKGRGAEITVPPAAGNSRRYRYGKRVKHT